MKKLICIAALLFAGISAYAQRQFVGTGQYQNGNKQVYIFACGPYGSAGTVPLSKPPVSCGQSSVDQATIYTSSALSTPITQPMSVAAGAQWTFYTSGTQQGPLVISTCTSAGSAATGSVDAVDPTQCDTYYANGSGNLSLDIVGDEIAWPNPATLPTVPTTGYNCLSSVTGGAAAWQSCPSADTPIQQTSYTGFSGTGNNNVAQINIPANRVAAGGSYRVEGSCQLTVASSMTASTFTPSLQFYSAANTTTYTIVGGNATASVATGTSTTIDFGVTLVANTSGAGVFLENRQMLASPVASTSLIGGANNNYLGGTLAYGSSGNYVALQISTSVANSTANTYRCQMSGRAQ